MSRTGPHLFLKALFLSIFLLCITIPGFATTIVLEDGTVLNGTIVETTDEGVIIDTSIGVLEIPQSSIREILGDGASEPGRNLESTSGSVTRSIIIHPQNEETDKIVSEIKERNRDIEEKKTELYFMLHEKQFRDRMATYEMQRLAGEIPYSERLDMYAAFERRDQGTGVGFNLLVPSLGSWLQKDVTGALIQDGTLLLGVGLLYWNGNLDYENNNFYNKENGQSDMLMYAGITVLLADWIFGIIRPITYVKKWNRQIALSLRISGTRFEKGYNPGPYDPYSERDAGPTRFDFELFCVEY
jgi:hypothetical protein